MDKRATTLELFFDLVFVFAITEVAGLVHDDLAFQGFARGAIVMAMLWWGWSQFTWAANAIDLEPRRVRAVIFVAMGVALIIAQSVPTAFDEGGLWLAVGYAVLRGLGLWQYWVGTGDDAGTRQALLPFIRWSSLGPAVMILGAFFDTRHAASSGSSHSGSRSWPHRAPGAGRGRSTPVTLRNATA